MDLPDVKAGMDILAEHIQRINASIRQTRMRPGIGYSVKESSGGTSLVIDRGLLGGSGGASLPCPFAVSDASEGTNLKVQVAWGLVWNMLPTGMFPTDNPQFKLDVTETCYIYVQIVFNTSTLIVNEVLITAETELKTNTATTQYNLIAVVKIDPDADPKTITSIKNICVQPFPSPSSLGV